MTPKQRKDQKTLQERVLREQAAKPKGIPTGLGNPHKKVAKDNIKLNREIRKEEAVVVVRKAPIARKKDPGEPGYGSFGYSKLDR